MTRYHSNWDVQRRDRQIAANRAGYENALLLHQEQRERDLAEDGNAPIRPTPPVPEDPNDPLPVFEARTVDKPTTIQTRTGEALVLPGRVVLSDGDYEFAVSAEELAADYTEVK